MLSVFFVLQQSKEDISNQTIKILDAQLNQFNVIYNMNYPYYLITLLPYYPLEKRCLSFISICRLFFSRSYLFLYLYLFLIFFWNHFCWYQTTIININATFSKHCGSLIKMCRTEGQINYYKSLGNFRLRFMLFSFPLRCHRNPIVFLLVLQRSYGFPLSFVEILLFFIKLWRNPVLFLLALQKSYFFSI